MKTKPKKQIKTNKNKLIYSLLIFIILIVIFQFFSNRIRIEDVLFKEILQDYSTTHIPYELYFSIINPKSTPINCIAILSLIQEEQINKTSYNIGNIPQRTKLKYKIQFNMPIGNTTINLDKNCTII